MKKKTIDGELKRIWQQVRAEYGVNFSRAIGNEPDLTDDFGATLDFATLDRPAKDRAYLAFKKLLDASPAKVVDRDTLEQLAPEDVSGVAIARFSARSTVRIGQHAHVAVECDRLHFFDAQTGEAI